MSGIFNKDGQFVPIPGQDDKIGQEASDDKMTNFLFSAGLIGPTEARMRCPSLMLVWKQEMEARRKASNQKRKKRIQRSKERFASEYNLLSRLSSTEHDQMHSSTVECLESNSDPNCVDCRSESESDTDRGIPETRIRNNCMCPRCRPEMYSKQQLDRWAKEREQIRNDLLEQKATIERERSERSERQRIRASMRKSAVAPVAAVVAVSAVPILSTPQETESTKEEQRKNRILPPGWCVRRSTKFPTRRYFEYVGPKKERASVWELCGGYETGPTGPTAPQETSGPTAVERFGIGFGPKQEVIDIYSPNVIEQLQQLGMIR